MPVSMTIPTDCMRADLRTGRDAVDHIVMFSNQRYASLAQIALLSIPSDRLGPQIHITARHSICSQLSTPAE